MTATNPGEPPRLPRPACTPAAIRTVLAANAGADTLGRYDADLDAAFELARTGGDLTPLPDTVRRWWFEADTWRDPAARREYQARVSRSHCRPAAAEPAGDPRAGPRTVRRLDACTGGNWTNPRNTSSPA